MSSSLMGAPSRSPASSATSSGSSKPSWVMKTVRGSVALRANDEPGSNCSATTIWTPSNSGCAAAASANCWSISVMSSSARSPWPRICPTIRVVSCHGMPYSG